MAKTLVRGLELIEDLGLYGPMTISELARRSGVHVSIVSRTVAMLDGCSPIPDFVASAGPDDDAPSSVPLSRADLDAEIAAIRADGFARDHGELHPAIHCIAAPWPTPELPASLACIGSREEIDTNRAAIEACLRAATKPSAGAQDIFAVAALAPANHAEAHTTCARLHRGAPRS